MLDYYRKIEIVFQIAIFIFCLTFASQILVCFSLLDFDGIKFLTNVMSITAILSIAGIFLLLLYSAITSYLWRKKFKPKHWYDIHGFGPSEIIWNKSGTMLCQKHNGEIKRFSFDILIYSNSRKLNSFEVLKIIEPGCL